MVVSLVVLSKLYLTGFSNTARTIQHKVEITETEITIYNNRRTFRIAIA